MRERRGDRAVKELGALSSSQMGTVSSYHNLVVRGASDTKTYLRTPRSRYCYFDPPSHTSLPAPPV